MLQGHKAGSADIGRFIKALVVGEPGSGKTRSASTWPNVVIANIEGGMMSVADRGTRYVTISSSQDMTDLLRLCEQNAQIRAKEFAKVFGEPNPVKVDTVVIDTFDEYARMLEQERLTQTRQDQFKIQDWGWLGGELRGAVRSFRNLDMNVIFTCHAKAVTDEDTGSLFVKPAVKGSFADEFPGYVDLAVLLTAAPETVVDSKGNATKRIVRSFQTFPDKRHQWLKDRSGRLPLEFPINLNDDYERLAENMFGHLDERQQAEAEEAVEDLVALADDLKNDTDTPVAMSSVEPETEADDAQPALVEEPKTLTAMCAGGKTVSGARNINQMELAEMKFGKPLCRECFSLAKIGEDLPCGSLAEQAAAA